MILDDYNILNEMLNELCQEAEEIGGQIEDNIRGIREAETYVEKIVNSQPEDFKIFSPRKAEIIYKEDIERANEKKLAYEELNKELYQKYEILNKRINDIKSILNRNNYKYSFLKIQEEDRQRIARDLHDTSLQNLAHLVHKVELSSMYIDKDPVQAKLELSVVGKRLRETIDDIRSTIFDLRPMTFDDLGLKAVLETLLINLRDVAKYEIISEIDDIQCKNSVILVSIYRVVQESFCNIQKHAEANKIIFQCKKMDDKCILIIEDNGKGFEKDSKEEGRHFGISLMRERLELLNGNIEILSEPGKGTRLYIEIPLKEVAG